MMEASSKKSAGCEVQNDCGGQGVSFHFCLNATESLTRPHT